MDSFRNSLDIFHVAFEAAIPSVGYSTYWYEEYRNVPPRHGEFTFSEFHAPARYAGTMQTGHRTWENEYLKINANDNGTLNVTCKATGKVYRDLLIFEDCADVGDGWNYRKPLKDSKYLSLGCNAGVSVEHDGPVSVCLKIMHTMQLPVGMEAGNIERSRQLENFTITTYVKMKKGSSRLEFRTVVDNNVSEHRLRVLFPTCLNTEKFYSSTPFYLQDRAIAKPDRSSHVETESGSRCAAG
jgi:hypothetical protein